LNKIALRRTKCLFSVALIAALSSVGLNSAACAARAPAPPPPDPLVCQVVAVEYDFTADDRGSAHSSPAIWVVMCPEVKVKTDAS
jgi:hypothetical protein